MVRYAFTVRDSHPLLLAGLPAHIGFVLQFAIEALGVAKLSVSLALTLPSGARRAELTENKTSLTAANDQAWVRSAK